MLRSFAALSAAALLCGFAQADARPELWGGLRVGMTPEEAAAVIMAKPGARNTRLGRTGREGQASMQVTAQPNAFNVGGERAELRPEFRNGRLESVRLILRPGSLSDGWSGSFCVASGRSILDRLAGLLAMKYEPVSETQPSSFTDGEIQVTPEMEISPASDLPWSTHCRRQGQGGETAYLTLTYEAKMAADSRAAEQQNQDRERLAKQLEGL